MRALILALLLPACAATPYDDLVHGVKQQVRYVSQPGADPYQYGCPAEGDCDDRALCIACQLVRGGASPEKITVVIEGWERGNPMNHMSIEYNGHCLAGYASTAYAGPCRHAWADSAMRTTRRPLPVFLALNNVRNLCQ